MVMRGADLDSLDPALSYSVASWSLLDPTCAPLFRYGRSGLRPDAATGYPDVSRAGTSLTFTIRAGLRFSDGSPLRADAFARAINRVLARGVRSPWRPYLEDVVGAKDVRAGRAREVAGVVARGRTLVVRLTRAVPDFVFRTTFLCAVPPSLPADAEGLSVFPAAGPYYVAEHRPGQSVVLRRNIFYGGSRPQHVDAFDVDLRPSSHEEVLDRIERGDADWGWALSQAYFDPARRLASRYGVNRRRFFVRPGAIFRGYAFNTSRPLFRNNLRLRRAVSYAIDRPALRRITGGPNSSRLTDQYLPFGMRGFRDARIYPLEAPDLARARALAKGHTRGGTLRLWVPDLPFHLAFAQSIKRNLAAIGLSVRVRGVALEAYFGRLMANGAYDLGFATWAPDYADPYAVLNIQLDGRFIGMTNWSRFDSPTFNRLLRRAAGLRGDARYRAYAALDARLAREAAPMVAVDFLTEPVLVSARVGCVAHPFDLAALCRR